MFEGPMEQHTASLSDTTVKTTEWDAHLQVCDRMCVCMHSIIYVRLEMGVTFSELIMKVWLWLRVVNNLRLRIIND